MSWIIVPMDDDDGQWQMGTFIWLDRQQYVMFSMLCSLRPSAIVWIDYFYCLHRFVIECPSMYVCLCVHHQCSMAFIITFSRPPFIGKIIFILCCPLQYHLITWWHILKRKKPERGENIIQTHDLIIVSGISSQFAWEFKGPLRGRHDIWYHGRLPMVIYC